MTQAELSREPDSIYGNCLAWKHVKNYLIREVSSIENPNDPTDIYVFPHLEELVEVLVRLLEYQCNEEALERVQEKVFGGLRIFAGVPLEPERMPEALEDLATGFEAFLKKIAVVRYGVDSVEFRGDGTNYLGLLHTTMGNLLSGRVEKANPRDRTLPNLHAPVVSFSYGEDNIRDSVYNRTRLLRNQVHTAPTRTILDLMRLFRITAAAYLLAVEENINHIRKKIDPLFMYLSKLEERFSFWDSRYIDLSGEERTIRLEDWPDLQVFEWHDDYDEFAAEAVSLEDLVEGSDLDDRKGANTSSHSAARLIKDSGRLWLIGEPGAGKSTTLQRAACLQARELLAVGYLIKPCPIYLSASQFDANHSFLTMICDQLGVDNDDVMKWMSSGVIWLIVDGLNEVLPRVQSDAHRELKRFTTRYPELHLHISSRKYGFIKFVDVPVFELLPLTDRMIQDFLGRNLVEGSHEDLFSQLTVLPRLKDFARNPLMLRMLTLVAGTGEFPTNRGQLFHLFMKWIFSRERKTSETSTLIKERVLAFMAYQMRQIGRPFSPKTMVLEWLERSLSQWREDMGVAGLFCELLDNHILEMDTAERVSFFHELVLEYFVAVELNYQYSTDLELVEKHIDQVEWFEPLVMLSGLLEDASDLVATISNTNIRLGARCIASGATVSPSTVSGIIKKASRHLSKPAKARDANIALIEIATEEALRLVIKSLWRWDTGFSLTSILNDCERPEQAAIELLNAGLSSRNRVYQCLRVFSGRPVSRTIIDNPVVGTAELILLRGRPEGVVESRELALIDELGVSKCVAAEIGDKVQALVEEYPLSAAWRNAVAILVNHGLTENPVDAVAARFPDADEPQRLYSFLHACDTLRSKHEVQQMALGAVRECLRRGLLGLASKYISLLHIAKEMSFEEVKPAIERMAEGGRIGALLGLATEFDEVDFQPWLRTAVDRRIEESQVTHLYRFRDDLANILEDKVEAIQDALLRETPRLKISTLRRIARDLGLQSFYSQIVTSQ